MCVVVGAAAIPQGEVEPPSRHAKEVGAAPLRPARVATLRKKVLSASRLLGG